MRCAGHDLCEKGQHSEASSLLKRAYDGEEFDLFGKAPLMQNLAVAMVKSGKEKGSKYSRTWWRWNQKMKLPKR